MIAKKIVKKIADVAAAIAVATWLRKSAFALKRKYISASALQRNIADVCG